MRVLLDFFLFRVYLGVNESNWGFNLCSGLFIVSDFINQSTRSILELEIAGILLTFLSVNNLLFAISELRSFFLTFSISSHSFA